MGEAIEKVQQVDHDDIALSAVKEFCLRPRPSRMDAIRLVDLVLPLLPGIADSSRRQIAATLATSPHAPKALLLAMCDFPAAISSPILTRSTLLSEAELLAILSQHGEDHARAIARRSKLPLSVVDALRSRDSEPVNRALDLRLRLDEAVPQEQRESFDQYKAEMHGDLADHAVPLCAVEPAELVELARDPDPAFLRTCVADAIGLTLVSATELCSNPTSRNLIHMLRFLRIPLDRSLEVFTALAPDLAQDDAVIARFEAVFRETTLEQAVRKVWSWRSDDLLALIREALVANDPGEAAEDRAAFDPDSILDVA